MARKLTLGKRIGSGIGIILILLVIVGAAGFFGLTRMLDVTNSYKVINTLQAEISAVKGMTDQYLLAAFGGDEEGKETGRKQTALHLDKSRTLVANLKDKLADAGDNGKKFTDAIEGLDAYKKHFGEYVTLDEAKVETDGKIIELFAMMDGNINKGEMFTEEMSLAGKLLTANYTTYVNRSTSDNWDLVAKNTVDFGKEIDVWYGKVEGSEMLKAIGDQLKPQYATLKTSLDTYHNTVLKQAELRRLMNTHIQGLLRFCNELGSSSLERLKGQAKVSNNLIIGFIIAALVIGILYGTISTRKIIKTIKTFLNGVSDISEQVASGAGQVSSASQALAEGASEQAASLEESSSSLEEMSAMVKQNADHADQAKSMMAEASQVLTKVDTHMNDMASAIGEISKSSEETGKIIKTIDEIAFQTNLLALNAAVEAARAGEAGAGFAVVADEVRNLAMRAADAARNTADLIETTIKTVKNGHELTEVTQTAFKENLEISGKVAGLVDEIAAASKEQSEGIEQVNRAVSEMDRVVQQNAANAEESAGASQEMDQQSGKMEQMVKDLSLFVGGASGTKQRKKQPKGTAHKADGSKELAPRDEGPKRQALAAHKGQEVSPDQVIPMSDNDEDFQDF